MWPTRQQTPKQLAIAGAWGVVFSMLAFWLLVIFRHELDLGPVASTRRLVLAAPLIVAVMTPITVLGYRAAFLLREGIRVQRWHEQQVEELRRNVEHPIWTAAIFLAMAVPILGLLFTKWHSIFSAAWIFLWMPVSLIIWLRHSLPKPPTSRKIFQ
jgi:hypothetical protein